jgi:exodeoxyribonuclease V beta subunit
VDLHKSGIGHLLGWQAGERADALPARLEQLCRGESAIQVRPAPEPDDKVWRGDQRKVTPTRLETFQGVPMERWWIASYSALQHETGNSPAPDSGRDENLMEQADEAPAPLIRRPEGRAGRHDFVRGPMAGTFLHGLLELLAEQGFDAELGADSQFDQNLSQRLTVRRWRDWQGLLRDWCADMIATPLPLGEQTLALRELVTYRAELEFMLQARQVPVEQLDATIREHVLPGHARPTLKVERLNGMLKGFIDLVFEHDGRYYVMDYKSNWLGPSDAAYSADKMREAVLHKRYDVQYSLYLLALHRLLKSRLGEDYDYDTRIGGAAYYFLRGLGADTRGIHFERPPAVLMEKLDALFRGELTHA